ncbi:MAG: ThiF family adenylyltransferase [Caldilineaceae bacterium]|nr:ThiF family adenylyltransferase [Caldilineaceae bacterium]
MSQPQINLSPDIKALIDDGYEIAIKAGHLVLYNVPYVNQQKEVKRGTLVSTLDMAGNVTVKPSTHVVMFAGDQPCDKNGRELENLKHSNAQQKICDGLVVERSFSCKPKDDYRDYYHKMTTYAEMLTSHALSIDPNATARTHAVIATDDPSGVFNYLDTASGRAGISSISQKLALQKVGIIGLGGTGSYVLDLITKTPIKEIHLFDSDFFLQHNAFRTPGAATLEELQSRVKKVDYLATRYKAMRKNIFAHGENINEANLSLLDEMGFVFICIDNGSAKQLIIEKLEADNTPFVDTGMGINLVDDKLHGIVRVTTSTHNKRDHFKKRVILSGHVDNDIYSKNIQIAELNALNASLAVIKWKKLFGFYLDLENEHSCNYTLDGNNISNIDQV